VKQSIIRRFPLNIIKFLLLGVLFIAVDITAQQFPVSYKSPLSFTKEVNDFLLLDKQINVAPQGVIITGSSSVRFWRSIHQDFTKIKVTSRGFGGSNMNDLLHFSEQLITQYQPSAVAIYEGDNDIAQGISPEKIVSKFIELKKKIRLALPNVRLYFISIKPSISRQKMWPQMAKTNQLIQAVCEREQDCSYIDVASNLLSNGLPKQDVFIEDGLHLNEKGYQLWSQAIVPIIERAEMAEANSE